MKLKSYLATASLAAGLLIVNSANAQWTRNAPTNQTYLTNVGDNLGVGTTNPTFKLDVLSTGIATMSFKSTTSNASILLDRGSPTSTASLTYRSSGTNRWQTGIVSNDNFTIRNNGLALVTIFCSYANNFVGIGTQAPTSKLHVLGSAGANDTLSIIQGITSYTGAYDVIGVNGKAISTAAGWGIGVAGDGNFIGTRGIGGNYGVVGSSLGIGVEGDAFDAGQTEFLTGVQGLTNGGDVSVGVYGSSAGAINNYGVYGDQQDTTAADYAVVCLGDLYYWRAFAPSDARLKSNIQPLTGALDKIGQLSAATYTFNKDKYPGMALPSGQQSGFLAADVEKVFPELVKHANLPAGASRDSRGKVTYHSIPDVMQVNYIGMIPVLAEAIKEQSQVVNAKEAEMNARMVQLENEIAELKAMLQEKRGTVTETGSLLQNVPNPANGNTTINFNLPENSRGVLQVTDASGKVVKSFNESGSGMQNVILNTESLSSGSYTYSLIINGKLADSKTMLISK